MKKIIKISEKEVFNDGVKKLIVKTFKDGEKTYDRPGIASTKHDSGTMILAQSKNGNIYYGKEFRFGPEKYVFSFSGGRQEPELTFEENARKELKEELGGETDELIFLGETIISSYEGGNVKMYLAKHCIFGDQDLQKDEHEDIKIYSCSIEEFEQKIVSGEINCPLTISCYTKAKLQNKI